MELVEFGLLIDRLRSTSAAARLNLVQDVVIQERVRRNQPKTWLLFEFVERLSTQSQYTELRGFAELVRGWDAIYNGSAVTTN